MLAKRIIPCLDVKDGVVVKGVKFRGHEVVGEIVPLAKRYAEEGADELVFYDITASSDGRVVDKSWISRVAEAIDIPFCVAGGIRTVEDAGRLLAYGADKISVNSPALADPDLISRLADRLEEVDGLARAAARDERHAADRAHGGELPEVVAAAHAVLVHHVEHDLARAALLHLLDPVEGAPLRDARLLFVARELVDAVFVRTFLMTGVDPDHDALHAEAVRKT